MDKKIVVITGASSGIGFDTAKHLKSKGYTVYALARRLDKLRQLESLGINIYQLDVTNYLESTKVINEIIQKESKIDVLFNNAGFGLYGPIEEISMEDAKYQFDVNLFALAHLIKVVTPYMRNQGGGLIINTSSIGGKVASLLGGWYHASKFALEGLSDSLRLELNPFNIKVVLLEPGLIQTEFPEKTIKKADEISLSSPYYEVVKKVRDRAYNDYIKNKVGSDPIVVAKTVLKIIKAKRPKTRYVVGKLGLTAILGRKFLSDKMLDKILMKR